MRLVVVHVSTHVLNTCVYKKLTFKFHMSTVIDKLLS